MNVLRTLIYLVRTGPLLLLILGSVSVAAQDARNLEWSEQAKIACGKVSNSTNYQVELEDILSEGKSILIGEPFAGDVRDLVFVVKNISDKPISFIQITLVLPELKRPAQVPFVRMTPDSKSTPVKPGEQTELRVPPGKVYEWVKETVAAQGMDLQSIRRAAIYSVTVENSGSPQGDCIKVRDPRNACPPP